MTEGDYQREMDLRGQASSKEAAAVLADFYEEHGQPSRAMLWRQPRHPKRKIPADLVIHDPKQRRKAMMWLLHHVADTRTIASAFRSSRSWTLTLVAEIEKAICEAANVERHCPTMAATQRLQAVGALPPRFDRGSFALGEIPPDDWPATSSRRKIQR